MALFKLSRLRCKATGQQASRPNMKSEISIGLGIYPVYTGYILPFKPIPCLYLPRQAKLSNGYQIPDESTSREPSG